MEQGVIKAILESENGWIAIILFALYIAFKLLTQYLANRKAKSKADALDSFFDELRMNLQIIQKDIQGARSNNQLIESINRRLTIIANKYNSELSREAAISVIQNVYFNFATVVIEEINQLRKESLSANGLAEIISARLSILNDEKIQELGLFLFRNRQLITYTTGEIIDAEIVSKVINSYANKNGMLAKELFSKVEMEMSHVIKRLQ